MHTKSSCQALFQFGKRGSLCVTADSNSYTVRFTSFSSTQPLQETSNLDTKKERKNYQVRYENIYIYIFLYMHMKPLYTSLSLAAIIDTFQIGTRIALIVSVSLLCFATHESTEKIKSAYLVRD